MFERNISMLKKIKIFLFTALILTALFCSNVIAAVSVVNIKVTNEGIDIYQPIPGIQYGYFYGPSIMLNGNGSIDIWASSPPDGVGWDSIRWIHSNDNGKTWSNAQVVLKPTSGKEDHLSTCDPGVVKFGGYYYIGYTSTLYDDATPNNVYIARSKNPNGPFDKWSGTGWGYDPKPVTHFVGDLDCGGGSMPSFLVKDNKIYMYYTYQDENGVNGQRLAIGDAADPNWPATLKDQGFVKVKANTPTTDAPSDVKYCDKYGKFIGVVVKGMMDPEARIQVYESTDGINFIETNTLMAYDDNIMPYNHNCGLSGTPDGHINLSMQNFIGYAYPPDGGDRIWGHWATRLAPVTITNNPVETSKASSVVKSSSKASSTGTVKPSSNAASSSAVSSSLSSSLASSEDTSVSESKATSSEAISINTGRNGSKSWIAIAIIAAVVLLGGGGVLLYLFVFKKKA